MEAASADEELYQRYAKLVYDVAFVIVGCRQEAEDLLHEVFVCVCETRAYDPRRGSVGAFLIAMTRSRAIDRLRRRCRSARLLESWQATAAPRAEPRSPFDQVAARRTAERVRAGLAGLPRAQREVLELAYYEGLSQREIASDLETPLGTVKSLSRRGLASLRQSVRP